MNSMIQRIHTPRFRRVILHRWIYAAAAALPLLFGQAAVASTGTMDVATSSAAAPSVAHLSTVRSLYGDSIEFEIFRNDAPVGTHRVTFEDRGGALKVVTDFELEVRALFITFFEMQYRSEALWRDGALVSLTARTNRNGDVVTVEAAADGDTLLGQGPNGPFTADLGIYPTNHWNAGVIGSTQLLNTITGRVNAVRLVPLGLEQVDTAHGVIGATRYRYDGAIDNEVWYDANGRWVQMRFPGEDGSMIELRCRKCLPTETAEVAF